MSRVHCHLGWFVAVVAVGAPISVGAEAVDAPLAPRTRLELVIVEQLAAEQRLEQAVRQGQRRRVVLADGHIAVLGRVDPNGRVHYLAGSNLEAARTVSADDVWPSGSAGLSLNGQGQVVGMWDVGGVRTTHRELTGRVEVVDSVPLVQHSTHVAGTIIATGVGPALHGMASQAVLRIWDFSSDESEMADAQLGGDPLQLSNHSYAFLSGWQLGSFGFCAGDPQWYWLGDISVSSNEDSRFGLYDSSSQSWDEVVFNAPGQLYLPIKSVGNDRGQGPPAGTVHCHFDGAANGGFGQWEIGADFHPVDGSTGFDSIAGGSGSAKNNLTVGAVHDLSGGYSGPGSVDVWVSSGTGPTDDGRIKPDLVANGVLLTSSDSIGDAASVALSGTSMAAASVTGSLALLRHHAEDLALDLDAATLKALVLHTADEAGVGPGPDYVFGWGLLNVRTAAQLLSAEALTGGHLWTGSLGEGGSWSLDLWSVGNVALRATLVWLDPPGVAQDGTVLDPSAPALINDLSLDIVRPSGVVALPWILDPLVPGDPATRGVNSRDTVEQVLISTPAAGRYQLRVSHQGVLIAPQAFALVVTGQRVDAIFVDGFESGTTGGWSVASP